MPQLSSFSLAQASACFMPGEPVSRGPFTSVSSKSVPITFELLKPSFLIFEIAWRFILSVLSPLKEIHKQASDMTRKQAGYFINELFELKVNKKNRATHLFAFVP